MSEYGMALARRTSVVMAACLIALCAAFAGAQVAYAATDGQPSGALVVGTMDKVKTKPAYGDDSINTTGEANVRTVYRYGWVSGGNNTAKSRTAKNLDVTGDGWADTIKVVGTKASRSGYLTRVRVYVNGKVAASYTNTDKLIDRAVVSVVTLKNKQPYLWVNVLDGRGNGFQRLSQWDEDGFYTVISNKDVAKTRTSNYLISELYPEGNKICVKYVLATTVTGITRLKYMYKYEDGWLYRMSNSADDFSYVTGKQGLFTKDKLTAAGKFKAYTSTSLSNSNFTVKSGNKVTIKEVRLQGKRLLYKIKRGSSVGWISCPIIKQSSPKAPATLFYETYGRYKLNTDIPTYKRTTYYSASTLQQYNDHALYIARNEILARHGYSFTNGELRSRFMHKSWYPSRKSLLNNIEKANVDLIRSIELNRGSLYI